MTPDAGAVLPTGDRHRVWLHIGTPKTGTTSLQATLYGNRELLAAEGLFYPDFGDIQHLPLARDLSRRAGSRIPFPAMGDAGPWQFYTQMLDGLEGRPGHSIVSSENFFQRPACVPGIPYESDEKALDQIRRLVEVTAAYFEGCRVTVLLWLRRQDRWLASLYNQTVKLSRYRDDFEAFARWNIGARYHDIVGLWADAFGQDGVICRSYDALMQQKADLLADFIAATGLALPLERMKLSARSNPSLKPAALWLKLRINAHLMEHEIRLPRAAQKELRQFLLEMSRTDPSGPDEIAPRPVRRALMERHLEANRALAAAYPGNGLETLAEIADLQGDAAAPEGAGMPPPAEAGLLHIVDALIAQRYGGKAAEADKPAGPKRRRPGRGGRPGAADKR